MELGLRTSVNSQIGALNQSELESLFDLFVGMGVTHWQVQLTVAMGNAADNPQVLLQPFQLLDFMPRLARLYHRGQDEGLLIIPGNNVGYFGPFEHLWRNTADERRHWTGCSAGETVLGIESDGTIKGCPSLETQRFGAGNIRDLRLDDLWRREVLSLEAAADPPALSGFCGSCYYAEICRAGCSWTAHSLTGTTGDNPYCHYRAVQLDRHGVRERVEMDRPATLRPFGTGRFRVIAELEGDVLPETPVTDFGPARRSVEDAGGMAYPQLVQCRGCNQFIWPDETTCPFCAKDVASTEQEYERERAERQRLLDHLGEMIGLRVSG